MRISDWSSDVCSSDLDARPAVHQPQAVAVAVEGDAEVAALPQHGILKLPQVLGHRGIGMMIGKAAVDLRVQQKVLAGKARGDRCHGLAHCRSEEHTSALQSLMRIAYAVFCLKKKQTHISID